MGMKWLRRCAILLSFLLAASGLFAQIQSTARSESKKEYLIQKGDIITFERFAGERQCLAQFPVRDDGKVVLPIAGSLQAAGRTPSRFTADIKILFAKYFERLEPLSLRVRDKSGVEHR